MTSDRPRVLITTAALAAALGLAAGAAAETIAGTDLEAAGLVADLSWAFEVTVEPATEEATVRTTRYRFKSAAPVEKTAAGNIYLRADLTAGRRSAARRGGGPLIGLRPGARLLLRPAIAGAPSHISGTK